MQGSRGRRVVQQEGVSRSTKMEKAEHTEDWARVGSIKTVGLGGPGAGVDKADRGGRGIQG